MKETKSNTTSVKETLVPWFETMGNQVGLSKRTISAILREQQMRIRKLNRESARVLSEAIKERDPKWGEEYNIYGKVACMLDRCKYIPCGSGACAQCTAAKQLHYQGTTIGNSLPGQTTLILECLRPGDEYFFSNWDASALVDRHETGY